MPISGTILNVATVVLGALLGLLVGHRLPAGFQRMVMGGLGLAVLIVGVQNAFPGNPLIMIGSILVGGIAGEAMRLQDGLDALGAYLQRRFGGGQTAEELDTGPTREARHTQGAGAERGKRASISEAFVTSSLVFCVGPMTILGSIQNGVRGDIELLAIKSLLDGFAAFAFAAALGWGVLLSAGTVLIYQGGLSLAAYLLAGGVPGEQSPYIVEMTAVGGLIILGVGLKLLDIKHLKLANYLPALAVAPLVVWVLEIWPWK